MNVAVGDISLRARRRRGIRLLSPNRERLAGLLILALLCSAFVVVPLVSSYGVTEFVGVPNQAPSVSHLFGTDNLGRDVFTRAFAGGRTDILIAALATSISLLIGTAIGVAVGITRSKLISITVLRIVDAVLAIPFVILILSLVIAFGTNSQIFGLPKGVGTVVLAIVVVDWAFYARLARAQALVLRDEDFVIAARLLKLSHGRILIRHVAPNVIPTTLSYAASDAILIIMGVASLAFLGAGIQEPTPELGNIMFQGHNYLATTWWITILPGVLVVLLGSSLALIADSFNDDD